MTFEGNENLNENKLWTFYWQVRFRQTKLNRWNKKIYRLVEYKFHSERFQNNKSEEREYKNIYQV